MRVPLHFNIRLRAEPGMGWSVRFLLPGHHGDRQLPGPARLERYPARPYPLRESIPGRGMVGSRFEAAIFIETYIDYIVFIPRSTNLGISPNIYHDQNKYG